MNDLVQNAQELFGLVTVMDAYVYKLKNQIDYSMPFDLQNLEYTGLCIDTLTISNINHNKIAQQFTVGIHGMPLIRNGQDIQLTFTDALIRAKTLKLFCGFKEDGTLFDEKLYLDNYDNTALTIIGKIKIATINGDYVYRNVVFPFFIPDSSFELTMSSKDSNGLSLNGKLYPVQKTNSTDWIYYYYTPEDIDVTYDSNIITMIEEVFDRFDIVTVMDVHIYQLTNNKHYGDIIKLHPHNGDIQDTGIVLQTLSISKLTSSAYKQNFAIGQHSIPMHKLNRQVNLTIQDALGNIDALQLFYDLHINDDQTISFVAKKQPQAYALHGTSYIKTVQGTVVPISIIIPCFVPAQVHNINMSSTDTSSVFDFSGTIYPSRVDFTNNFVYFYLHTGHEFADYIWHYGLDSNKKMYAYVNDFKQTEYITPTSYKNYIVNYITPPLEGASVSATKLIINTPCVANTFANFSNVKEVEINVSSSDIESNIFQGCNNINTIKASWEVIKKLSTFIRTINITTLHITEGHIETSLLYELCPNLQALYLYNNATIDDWFYLNKYFEQQLKGCPVYIDSSSTTYSVYKDMIYTKSYDCWVYAPRDINLSIGPTDNYTNQLHPNVTDYSAGVLYGRVCNELEIPERFSANWSGLIQGPDPTLTKRTRLRKLIIDYSLLKAQDAENVINKNIVDILVLNNSSGSIKENDEINFSLLYSLTITKYINLDIDHNINHTFNVEDLQHQFTTKQPRLHCALGQYTTLSNNSDEVSNILYKYENNKMAVWSTYQNATKITISGECTYIPSYIFAKNAYIEELCFEASPYDLTIANDAFKSYVNTEALKRIYINRRIPFNIKKFASRLKPENQHLEQLHCADLELWAAIVNNNNENDTNILLNSPKCELFINGTHAYKYFIEHYSQSSQLDYLPSYSFQNSSCFNTNEIQHVDLSGMKECGYAIFKNCAMRFVKEMTFNHFAPGLKYDNKQCKLFGGFWSTTPYPSSQPASLNLDVPSQIQHITINEPMDANTWSSGAFRNCKNIVTCVLNDQTTVIPANMFRACESLEAVTIPHNVQIISPNLFHGCTRVALISNSQLRSMKWNIKSGLDRSKMNTRALSCFNVASSNQMEYIELDKFAIIDRHFIIDSLQIVPHINDSTKKVISEGKDTPRLYITAGFNSSDTVTIPYKVWDDVIPRYQLETYSVSGVYAERFVVPSYAIVVGTTQFANKIHEGRGVFEYSPIATLEFGSNPAEFKNYYKDKFYQNNIIDNNALVESSTPSVYIYCNQAFKNKYTNNSIVNTFGYSNPHGEFRYIVS